jgi:hypothetical protein
VKSGSGIIMNDAAINNDGIGMAMRRWRRRRMARVLGWVGVCEGLSVIWEKGAERGNGMTRVKTWRQGVTEAIRCNT